MSHEQCFFFNICKIAKWITVSVKYNVLNSKLNIWTHASVTNLLLTLSALTSIFAFSVRSDIFYPLSLLGSRAINKHGSAQNRSSLNHKLLGIQFEEHVIKTIYYKRRREIINKTVASVQRVDINILLNFDGCKYELLRLHRSDLTYCNILILRNSTSKL